MCYVSERQSPWLVREPFADRKESLPWLARPHLPPSPAQEPANSSGAATATVESAEPQTPLRELTLRAVILGGLITLVFTAANVYLGLKVGLTFATSIPAAVISMAVLRKLKNHSITENNIVQTIASAAGTLSAIIFVLPGLIMIGWWTGFPYWTTMLVCLIGGVLGVMYSIPLRRALVTNTGTRDDLPFPEGVAAAEVLKVGDGDPSNRDNRDGLIAIIVGGLASAGMSLLTALKVTAGELSATFKLGAGGAAGGDDGRFQSVAGADRCRPPRRPDGRHRHDRRPGHLLRRPVAGVHQR